MSALEKTLAMHIRAAKLPEPTLEHKFHATRKWRFDFAWPELKFAVECEGGHWTNGRHTRGAGFAADSEKYNEAMLDGWRVLRVVSEHIKSGQALAWIERAIK
jgi:very-short-patch-repair endonuclease